jgi:prepilin-type N-terminal cleavage/methylation domain-containing protein
MSIANTIVRTCKQLINGQLLAINLLNRKGEMSMLKMFRKGNQKGFTLIELLIVVAIIGILAAIAIPQFASYRQKAFNSAAQSDIKTIKTSLEGFYTDEYYYPF